MSDCPACATPLNLAPEYPVQRCAGCSSIWLSQQELRDYVRGCMKIQRLESELVAFQEAPAVGPVAICPGCAQRSLKPARMRAVDVSRCAPCDGVFLSIDAAELIAQRVIVAAQEWTEGRPLTGNMKLDDILRNPNRSMGG